MPQIGDVVILDGVRTAVGSYGGSLASMRPIETGTLVAKEAIQRSGVEAAEVDHAVFGHIVTTGDEDVYLSRAVALNAGMAESSKAMNVNRLCGSAIQSIVSATQLLALGDSKIALAGGAESMSNGVYFLDKARFGYRMGHGEVKDIMLAALHDPFKKEHMGITAERIADRYGFSREEMDAYAVESHVRAKNAIEAGYFKDQILPVSVKQGRKQFVFDQDEHVRFDASLEGMAKLRPAFRKEGSVTAGNASGVNDGAAALVLSTMDEASKRNLKPRARIVSYGFGGVDPDVMGLGPICAVPEAMAKAGLSVADMDVIESNEAFAVQAMAVAKDLEFDPAKVNPNGGAVALGHPVGATGSIITLKLLSELERTGGRYGLATMCIGGGQGIALIIERLG
ncbi:MULTISPECIES: beta-ketothiolase BktB [Pseudovibrio]|uniref:beta-ketothiolase BktB n=1 Tax=Stappiaceae TaxID=2821832 RepID=UPI0023671C59|nr:MULTISPECIES: beta-ketothiolase BktB [Pseudovibrio]MDD7908411.1 beta-ketothiolase BktB [Pseudovibrio exalbescens]MDX5592612.1 beta-ketothiolase BktB [Pseudovibrio sp. SPO723]